ncbi:MAG: hypothetical protein AB1627_00140 [Chloroflexota bacterium]
MRRLRMLLGEDRVNWLLAAGELVAGGVGVLGTNQVRPEANAGLYVWLLYWAVVLASALLVLHALLSILVLAYERWRVLWESRTRVRFQRPIYLAPARKDEAETRPTAVVAAQTTPADLQPVKPAAERVFVDVAPDYLWGLYDGRMAVQGDALVQPYLGKWLKFNGDVNDIQSKSRGELTLVPRRVPGWGSKMMMLHFDANWRDRVQALPRDAPFFAVGQIARVTGEWVSLEHCELVTPPVATAPATELLKPLPAHRDMPADEWGSERFPFRLRLWQAGPSAVHLRVLNDGPTARFKADVLSVTSPHFDRETEATDWPWPIRWGSNEGEEVKIIEAASRADLSLVLFDERGAIRQVTNRGGYAFIFHAPKGDHRVRGRLGVRDLDELKTERLTIALAVTRLGDPEYEVRVRVCFTAGTHARFCEREHETTGQSWTKVDPPG